MKIITTSWDDGHGLDFKLAGLLDKYNVKGTFYIPQHNSEQPVMNEQQIKELSATFEIGGHTIHHTRLKIGDKKKVDTEVEGCYKWLSDVTGKAPIAFAFPGGKLDSYSLSKVFEAGFKVARTTELLSMQTCTPNGTMPTTLQLYRHSRFTYFRHLTKRIKVSNLTRWLLHGSPFSLLKLTEAYINDIQKTGGCFHLWGHSYEIEQYKLWRRLEEVLKLIAGRNEFQYLTNGDIRNRQ